MDDAAIVGHVAFSPVTVDGAKGSVGLAPVGYNGGDACQTLGAALPRRRAPAHDLRRGQ
jgi:predicted N-acetyltransferase YhbS